MKKRILWIEDDYHVIKGLVRPIEKEGFIVDSATSALEGYKKAPQWQSYDLIVVDIILPINDGSGSVPKEVQAWQAEEHAGIGLLKWIKLDLKVKIPVVVLSVVRDPIKRFDLGELGIDDCLIKRGLLPEQVKKLIFGLLGIDED